MGKRRIEIKKIENQQSLYVTFSKRRAGLFKKASDFCQISESDVALVVFSPAGNVFEWGNTSTRAILDRFLAANQFQSSSLSATDTTPPLFPEMERCLNIDISKLSEAELQEYLHDLDAAEAELLILAQQDNQTPPPPSDQSACVLEQGIINSSSSSSSSPDDDDVNLMRVIPNCIDCHGSWIDGEEFGLCLDDLMATDNPVDDIPIDLAAVNTADFLVENRSDEDIGLRDLLCKRIEEDDNSWIMTSYSDYSSCGTAMAKDELDSMVEELMEGSNNCSHDAVLSEDLYSF